MSIYVMTVGELAKKRGVATDEFIKNLRELGFGIKGASKKLTQEDLDVIILSLQGDQAPAVQEVKSNVPKVLDNPNVLLLTDKAGKFSVVLVDVKLNDDNSVSNEVVSVERNLSKGEALLEFRKLQGIKMGVNR